MNADVKEFVSWLGMIGIPSIFTMTIWCIRRCFTYTSQLKILCAAQKAQMRSQLLNQYYYYKKQGSICSDDLDDWMNQYKAYHELVGDNGVLEKRKAELLALPTTLNRAN